MTFGSPSGKLPIHVFACVADPQRFLFQWDYRRNAHKGLEALVGFEPTTIRLTGERSDRTEL